MWLGAWVTASIKVKYASLCTTLPCPRNNQEPRQLTQTGAPAAPQAPSSLRLRHRRWAGWRSDGAFELSNFGDHLKACTCLGPPPVPLLGLTTDTQCACSLGVGEQKARPREWP